MFPSDTQPKTRNSSRSTTTDDLRFGDSTRVQTSDDRAFWEIVRKLKAGEMPATEPDVEPSPACELCEGKEWLRYDVPLTDPHFGQVYACPVCTAPGLRQRELDALWGQAEIPTDFLPFTFETFRQTRGDLRACDRIENWAVRGEGSLYVSGNFRRGKTILCVCAMRYRMDVRQVGALYVPAVDLMGRIRDTYNRREGDPIEGEVVASATDVGLLLLDDIGTNSPTAHVEEVLYRIINRRQIEHRPMIFTSNLTLRELGRQIGARTALRIKRMCGPEGIVRIEGPNLEEDEDEAL